MTPLQILEAQRDTLLAQIATIVALGAAASDSQIAMLRVYRRQLMSVNAQIIILVNEPEPEEEPPF